MINKPRYKLMNRECFDLELFRVKKKFFKGRVSSSRFLRCSEYKEQLIAKRRIKIIYGLSESKYKSISYSVFNDVNYASMYYKGFIFELRLDNVLFRSGLLPTRRSSRQFVSHGHVILDGVVVVVPSFILFRDYFFVLSSKFNFGFAASSWFTCVGDKVYHFDFNGYVSSIKIYVDLVSAINSFTR